MKNTKKNKNIIYENKNNYIDIHIDDFPEWIKLYSELWRSWKLNESDDDRMVQINEKYLKYDINNIKDFKNSLELHDFLQMEVFISPVYNYGYNNNEEVFNFLLPIVKKYNFKDNIYKPLLEDILMNSYNNLDFSLMVFSENPRLSYFNDLHKFFIENNHIIIDREEKINKYNKIVNLDITTFGKYKLDHIYDMPFNFNNEISLLKTRNGNQILLKFYINNGSVTIKADCTFYARYFYFEEFMNNNRKIITGETENIFKFQRSESIFQIKHNNLKMYYEDECDGDWTSRHYAINLNNRYDESLYNGFVMITENIKEFIDKNRNEVEKDEIYVKSKLSRKQIDFMHRHWLRKEEENYTWEDYFKLFEIDI